MERYLEDRDIVMVKSIPGLLLLFVLSSPVLIVIGLFVASQIDDAKHEREATRFCDQVSVGATVAEIQQFASEHDVDLVQDNEDTAVIYWFDSMGVGAQVCMITFRQHLVASSYVMRWIP